MKSELFCQSTQQKKTTPIRWKLNKWKRIPLEFSFSLRVNFKTFFPCHRHHHNRCTENFPWLTSNCVLFFRIKKWKILMNEIGKVSPRPPLPPFQNRWRKNNINKNKKFHPSPWYPKYYFEIFENTFYVFSQYFSISHSLFYSPTKKKLPHQCNRWRLWKQQQTSSKVAILKDFSTSFQVSHSSKMLKWVFPLCLSWN